MHAKYSGSVTNGLNNYLYNPIETGQREHNTLKYRVSTLTCIVNSSFVNISPTVVIGTLMERSSIVLQHGNPKNL